MNTVSSAPSQITDFLNLSVSFPKTASPPHTAIPSASVPMAYSVHKDAVFLSSLAGDTGRYFQHRLYPCYGYAPPSVSAVIGAALSACWPVLT